MSEGLNKVQLIGNLGADPELKYANNGNACLRLRLATTEKWMKDGQKQERTEWHTVILWGKRAEALNKLLEKGRTIYVEGRIQTRQWEDKEGGKRYSTEVVGENVLLLGGGQRSSDRRAPEKAAPEKAAPEKAAPEKTSSLPADDADPWGGEDPGF